MNEKPKSFWRKSWPTPRWLRVWLMLVAGTFPITLISFLLSTHLNGWPDVLPALLFVLVVSAIIASVIFWLWRLVRWLCCWRNLRRALFACVCAATFIALFYAEEDWRGKHAWDQFRHSGEDKIQHDDIVSIAPPPVPDDQNFALAPIVVSSYGQMIDRTGHEIKPRNTNLVDRLAMDYEVYFKGVDYPTNEVGDWAQGRKTDFRFLQQYYRTLATKTNLFPVPTQPQSPAADVLLALSRFDAPIAELRQAAQLPYSRFPLEYDKDDPAEILLPHLAALKRAGRVLHLRALAELQTGQSDQALADVLLIQRLTEAVRTEPFTISHLVRIAMENLMLQPVWEGLAAHQWSDAQLATLDGSLSKLDFFQDYPMTIRAEAAGYCEMTQYLRRNPGQYSRLSDFYEDRGPEEQFAEAITTLLMNGHLVPAGWFYLNQLNSVHYFQNFMLPVQDVSTHTFVPAVARKGDAYLKNERQHPSIGNRLECQVSTWLANAPRRFARAQNSLDLARVAIALERYRLAQGKFPDALESLAPQYLNPIPHDIIGGQPLHYHLTDDGQFVLYSVGWNETDDNGVVITKPDLWDQPDVDQGDWVWRYPAK